MSNNKDIFDKRSNFFRSYFEKGLDYQSYLNDGSEAHRKKWNSYIERLKLSDSDAKLLCEFKRKMNILVLSGIWCGDCARQGPIIKIIEDACPTMVVRYLDNRENPELQDELRVHGGARVPVVVVLSEDFYEVSRFGDRTISAYKRKVASETGPACDAGIIPPTDEELTVEVHEWVEHFERNHALLRTSGLLRSRYGD